MQQELSWIVRRADLEDLALLVSLLVRKHLLQSLEWMERYGNNFGDMEE